MKRIVCLMVSVVSLIICCMSVVHAENDDLGILFADRGVKGTLVIASLDGQTQYVHNAERAAKRMLPASTFKIPNTLIALEEGAVVDEKEIIKWDGVERDWQSWNKDHSIETAFPVSCVWFYQELARRVGDELYQLHLKKLQYGNEMTGPDVTTFWLDGNLKISALEQIDMLKKLYTDALPYQKKHMDVLKKIMIVEETSEYTIRAKTGWAMPIDKQHGWYVGYVETKGQVWFFAMNMDINDKSEAAYRKEITMEALKVNGII